MDPEEEDEREGGNVDLHGQVQGKCCVIKTSTRQVRKKKRKEIER